jgi:hypothetical protein
VHGLLICSAAGRQTVNRSSYIASAGTLSRYDRSAVLRVMHELSAGFSERLDESPPATEIQRFQEVDACMDVQKAVLSLGQNQCLLFPLSATSSLLRRKDVRFGK